MAEPSARRRWRSARVCERHCVGRALPALHCNFMPTYEYKCNKCGHRFEKFQSIMSGPIRKCPECGKNAVERLISAGGGLIFKGSGFYITDYRDASYKDSVKAESGGDKGKTDAAATPGGEAKPAASSDSKGESHKGDSKGESKPAAKSDNKSENKSENKTESKPAKPEPKPVAKSSSKKR